MLYLYPSALKLWQRPKPVEDGIFSIPEIVILLHSLSRKEYLSIMLNSLLKILAIISIIQLPLFAGSDNEIHYYKDYVEIYGIPQGIGELTLEEQYHRLYSWRIIKSDDKVIRLTRVNSYGNPTPPEGLVETYTPFDRSYSYSDDGNILEYVDFSEGGNPLNKATYLSPTLISFQKSKSINVIVPPDISGEWLKDTYIYFWELTLDAEGKVIKRQFLDKKGNPTNDYEDAFGHEFSYTKEGQIASITYTNRDGFPAPQKDGIASIHYSYNDDFTRKEERFLDTEKKAILNKRHYSIAKSDYDPYGNRIRISYFNTEEKPCYHKDHYSIFTTEYDARGNLTRDMNFDTEGKPCADRFEMMSSLFKYDERGNPIEISTLDTEGNLLANKMGQCFVVKEYSQDGLICKVSHFDENKQPAKSLMGEFSNRVTSDNKKNVLKVEYLDQYGAPMQLPQGMSSITFAYDSNGNMIELHYFDTKGDPIIAVKLTLDDEDREIKREYFDADGKRCLCGVGYSIEKTTYDEMGRMKKETRYGIDEKPVLENTDFTFSLYKYDNLGNKTAKYYDAFGRLINSVSFQTE